MAFDPTCLPPNTLLGGPENMKLLFDIAMQKLSDEQADARAWKDLNLRRAHNSATLDHFINMTTANAGQTGDTENQQSVTPVRTAAADNLAAGAVPSNRTIDVAAAGIATANQALADLLAKFSDAVSAIQLAATGLAAASAASPSTPTK